MEKIYAFILDSFNQLIELASHNEFVLIILALLAAFGILGQVVLYYKCGLPGVASVIPFWNVVVFLKIMGRPAWQSIFIILPPPVMIYVVWSSMSAEPSMAMNAAFLASSAILLVFAVVVYVELCKSFGKNNIGSYLACLLFNGFYVMYLGMSGDTEYKGPLYGPKAIKEET